MSTNPSARAPTLLALPLGHDARVLSVDERTPSDFIARRLRELGFVPGEQVRVVAQGPIGGDPLLVQVGYTRFALRRAEAGRVQVEPLP